MTTCHFFIASVLAFVLLGAPVVQAADNSSDPVKVSLPLSARNSNGVEFEREALIAGMATDGAVTSCSGGTMHCSIGAPDTVSVTFTCGCCGVAAGCMNATNGILKLLTDAMIPDNGQDVLEVDAQLVSAAPN